MIGKIPRSGIRDEGTMILKKQLSKQINIIKKNPKYWPVTTIKLLKFFIAKNDTKMKRSSKFVAKNTAIAIKRVKYISMQLFPSLLFVDINLKNNIFTYENSAQNIEKYG